MAKKKSKKSSKKKQKLQKEDKNETSEVSKEMYEIQLSDLNSKVERMKHHCVDLQTENDQIRKKLTQENEDRADIILYLKRMLQLKNDDITELKEQVLTLQQAREEENLKSFDKIAAKENELQKLEEQLTTEINLLNDKLNVLDEFRVQKEELSKKFKLQEEAQSLKELQYEETLHNVEKDFIMKKVRMKKEVEERLIKLSEDFQTIMQSKIDSTTRVTIVENNTLKLEMKKLMSTCTDLIKENDTLKKKEKELKIQHSLVKEELGSSNRRYVRLKEELQKVVGENDLLKSESYGKITNYQQQIQKLSKNVEEYEINVRRQMELNEQLNQKLSIYNRNEGNLSEKLKSALSKIEDIENVIERAASIIKTILKVQDTAETDYSVRMAFASSLLEILNIAKLDEHKHEFLIQ